MALTAYQSLKKTIKNTPVIGQLFYMIYTAGKKGLFNPVVLFKYFIYLPKFTKEYFRFKSSQKKLKDNMKMKYVFPVFVDYSGIHINRHYWFQDIHVASKIIALSRSNPQHLHIDIGSRVEGFITSLISAQVNLIFGDINLPKVPFPNVEAKFIDLQGMTPQQFANATSVSSLHVIEHLGLGKYGDKIDALGHRRVFEDFARVLPQGCQLFLSSPVSNRPGIHFNAARDLDPNEMIADARDNGFQIDEVAIVQDDWQFDINPTEEQLYRSDYGCLILSLTKI